MVSGTDKTIFEIYSEHCLIRHKCIKQKTIIAIFAGNRSKIQWAIKVNQINTPNKRAIIMSDEQILKKFGAVFGIMNDSD